MAPTGQIYNFGIQGIRKLYTRAVNPRTGRKSLSVTIKCGPRRRSRNVDLLSTDRKLEDIFVERNGSGMSLQQFKNGAWSLLLALQQRDNYTAVHSLCVPLIATMIGERLELSPLELELLKMGGLFHDIGKVGISDGILTKPDKLEAEEETLMRTHPLGSVLIVSGLISGMKDDMRIQLLEMVKYHHLHFNGKGYPEREKGLGQLSLLTYILAMADAFDAMTTNNKFRLFVKRDPTLEDKIIDIERNKGKQFHPGVADICLELVREGISVSADMPIPPTSILPAAA